MAAIIATAIAFTSFGSGHLLGIQDSARTDNRVRTPLHAAGGKIVDAQGKEVVLTGVN